MRCINTRVLPEPGPASTSTLVCSRSSATMRRWMGLFRLSTIARQDSGVVWREVSVSRFGSQRLGMLVTVPTGNPEFVAVLKVVRARGLWLRYRSYRRKGRIVRALPSTKPV